MRKKKLLFATLGGGYMEAGFEYARELAGTLGKDICVLVVVQKKVSEKLEDIFAATAFAEAYGHETAREILRGGSGRAEDAVARLRRLIAKSDLSGIMVEVHIAEGEITKIINTQIEKDPEVDLVLLGPSVAEAAVPKAFKRLVSGISKPVVTMARQHLAG